MKVGVVGLGLIGGSLLRGQADGIGTDGSAADAVGFDADPAVREAAAAEGFAVVEDLGELSDREIVIVAVPPSLTGAVSAAVLDAAPEAVVADTASVKGVVLGALPDTDRFVGAHPLAGAETVGWAASSASLVTGAVWAVCPAGPALEPVRRLSGVVDRLGGRLVACTAAEHDAAVARTSHVPHLTALSLVRLVAGEPLRAALSGPGFRDGTRVARADPVLWADILLQNRAEVVAALDALDGVLADCRAALETGDDAALVGAWASATDTLAGVDAARWTEPAWRDEPVEDGWAGLLALGRAGRAVRRLRTEAGDLHAEVAR